jgi:hypothetical protein
MYEFSMFLTSPPDARAFLFSEHLDEQVADGARGRLGAHDRARRHTRSQLPRVPYNPLP